MLVSEVMLQQTQTSRVIEPWERFLERFPTPSACADAPLAEVLNLWRGLGYPRRAKALHDAARTLRDDFGGAVPRDPAELRGPLPVREVMTMPGDVPAGSWAYAFDAALRHRRSALKAGVLALCLLGVVILCGWGTLSSQRTTPNTADVLFVRVFPFPDRVAWFAAHGMPQANRIDRLAADSQATSGQAKVVGFSLSDPAFQPFERWLRLEGGHTYALWLVTHPWYVVSEPLQRPERAFNFAQGNLDFYAPVTDPAKSPLTTLLWPPLLELLVLSAVPIYLGIVSEAWRTAPWRVVGVLTLVGMAGMLMAWHGDGQEVTRHTVEGFAEVRLGVWLLFAMGLLSLPFLDRAQGTPLADHGEGEAAVRPPSVVEVPGAAAGDDEEGD